MKRLLFVVLVLVVAVGALSYWRGWFNVTTAGKVDVDSAKFKEDKEVFTKTVGEKAKAMKEQVARLWEKSEGMTGEDKARTQKELGELRKEHERIEQQIKELDEAGADRFEKTRQDLTQSLAEVERKTAELTKKLEKGQEK